MMSTHQRSNGQPEGPSAYAQPQDPWAGGGELGLASVPTDPIPQQYHPYEQDHPYPQGEAWSQPTVAHAGTYGHVPAPPRRNRAGMVVAGVLAVLVLGAAGAYGSWYVTTHNGALRLGVTTSPTAGAASTEPTSTPPPPPFPYSVRVGDCLVNDGTEDDPRMATASCDTPQSYKVIKVSSGADIPEGPGGRFDRDTTSVAVCGGTDFTDWYGYNWSDDTKDLFFCLTKNAHR